MKLLLGPDAYRRCRDVKEEELPVIWKMLDQAINTGWTRGIGLSAIQLSLPVRAAIIRSPQLEKSPKFSLNVWNPKVLEMSGETFNDEGCLSYPNLRVKIRVFNRVKFVNGDGKEHELTGLPALIFQHEYRHMEGRNHFMGKIVGRNDKCPCGSGTKYKKCCLP